MRLFAISDLHLSGFAEKPMDIFGSHWKNHQTRIRDGWCRVVEEGDTVLVPGDLSWAMTLDEALVDLGWIGDLPGSKVFLKGNHDYWWASLARMRAVLPPGMIPLQNTAVDRGCFTIAGARGWKTPGSPEYSEGEDGKIFRRELQRLSLSLDHSRRIGSGGPLVVMMHYPPVVEGSSTGFSELIADAGADICVYGHLHAAPGEWTEELDTVLDGVSYRLVSADRLDFVPLEIPLGEGGR